MPFSALEGRGRCAARQFGLAASGTHPQTALRKGVRDSANFGLYDGNSRTNRPAISVGVPRLERGTPCSQSRCASQLRHTPMQAQR